MFPISSNGVCEDPSLFFDLEDLLVDFDFPTSSDGHDHGEKKVKKRPRKASPSGEAPDNNEGSSDSKKSAHRFTEKQRRQEMAALYASLRSLLPLQYIKGKRAISDHMHQATNYINDMKKKIEEMQMKREGLRKLQLQSSNVGSCSVVESQNYSSSTRDSSDHCVEVNISKDGLLMEILISSGVNKECFPLSMVLADLLGRELSVVHCVSTRTDRFRYLHKIQIELNDSTRNIDASELQEGVLNVIKLACKS